MPLELPFYGDVPIDAGDVFAVKNRLADGQSEADVSGVSAIKGDGGLTNGVHGVNDGANGRATDSPSGGVGVWGESNNGVGVFGSSGATDGIRGVSRRNGIHGISDGPGDSGVWGEHRGGGYGVSGSTSAGDDKAGVWGSNSGVGYGVKGSSAAGHGVVGITGAGDDKAGVWGNNAGRGVGIKGTSTDGVGVYGESYGSAAAGYFKGNVIITGDVSLPRADLAEDFALPTDERGDPGTVMVIDLDECVRESTMPYDRCVAGVVAGAGTYKPAIVLNRDATDPHRRPHAPIALAGRAYCKVDADLAEIEVGDLLVTSTTAGHAMSAADPARAFGAVIGKALKAKKSGRGLIPILIALQ
jgi:hypothetical protein